MKKSPLPPRNQQKARKPSNNDQLYRIASNQQQTPYSNHNSNHNHNHNAYRSDMKQVQMQRDNTGYEQREYDGNKNKQTHKQQSKTYKGDIQMNSPRFKELRRPQFLKHISGNGGNRNNDYGMSALDSTPRGNRNQNAETHTQLSPRVKAKNRELRETTSNDFSEYQKLHDKLNYLQNKIVDLSNNIDKKREEKLAFFQQEKKERQRRFQKIEKQRQRQRQKGNTHTKTNTNTRHQYNPNPKSDKTPDPLKKFITQVPEQKDYLLADFNPYSPRHSLYYISEIIKFHKEEKSLARDHLISSAQFLRMFQSAKIPPVEEIASKCVGLQKRHSHLDKKTVVFDLDETLIHCNQSVDLPHDLKVKIRFPTGECIQAGINIRPYAVELLKAISKNFQVIVFTASHSCYANVVLDHLDPTGELIHHRLYREHCVFTPEGVYVKDLRILNRDPSQVLLVDNAAYSYAFQLENAIPILPYYKGKHDYELKALQGYLESMLFAKDVREVNKRMFKLSRYGEFNDVEMLVKGLYHQWM